MCNRYRMSAKQQELAIRYGIEAPYPEDVTVPPPELFPDRIGWIVRPAAAGEGGSRVLDTAAWGFPMQVRGASGKPVDKRITNVRNLASPFWRSALVNPERRCLVPVSDFCEWSGEKGAKVAHWFALPSRPIFSFAGVWRPVGNAGAKAYAFLTCGYEGDPAAHIVGRVHPKACPVILHEEDEARWLAAPLEDVLDLVGPYPSQLITVA